MKIEAKNEFSIQKYTLGHNLGISIAQMCRCEVKYGKNS